MYLIPERDDSPRRTFAVFGVLVVAFLARCLFVGCALGAPAPLPRPVLPITADTIGGEWMMAHDGRRSPTHFDRTAKDGGLYHCQKCGDTYSGAWYWRDGELVMERADTLSRQEWPGFWRIRLKREGKALVPESPPLCPKGFRLERHK